MLYMQTKKGRLFHKNCWEMHVIHTPTVSHLHLFCYCLNGIWVLKNMHPKKVLPTSFLCKFFCKS